MSEIDIKNLTQEDFLEMARYVQYLEEQILEKDKDIAELKTYAITLATQRNNAEKRYKNLQLDTITQSQPIVTTINVEGTTIYENPSEQYRLK
jgi:hypothetical protein